MAQKTHLNKKIRPSDYTKCQVTEVKAVYKTARKGVTKVNSSKDAFNQLWPLYDQDTIAFQESMYVLFLNRANNVTCWFNLSKGGVHGTVADPKILFALALQTNSFSIVISHNHPTGTMQPSTADKKLTEKVKQGCKILDLCLLDHIIIAPNKSYYSFADEGQI